MDIIRDCKPTLTAEEISRVYDANILTRLQSLLATLADIEFAHQFELDAVRQSTTGEVLRRTIVRKLQQQHRERRAPYVRQIDALRGQTTTVPV